MDELEDSDTDDLNLYLGWLSEGDYSEFVDAGNLTGFTASFYKSVPPEWFVETRWLDDTP